MADRLQSWFLFHHLFIFICLLLLIRGQSFDDSPNDFYDGDSIELKVNKLASNKTQFLYSYYSVPYCRPDHIVNSIQNLGEILRGDHIQNSPYKIQMGLNMMSNIVCRIVLNEKTAKEFKEKIDDEYRANMILDHLPLIVPVTMKDHDHSQLVYQLGYFIGGKVRCADTKKDTYFINNHLSFVVRYHRNLETPSKRIVGFEAKAFSIDYDNQWSNESRMCDPYAKGLVTSSHPPQEVDDKKDIFFTYDVVFQETDIKWASRWEAYNLIDDDEIHWFPIVNSLMNVLLISGMVAAAMLATLHREVSHYNQLETLEAGQEETGWKLIHMDVFRPPVNSGLLSVYVGTGVQFFGMIVITIFFGALGLLSPSYTGGLMTDIIFLWALMGIFGGFAMARLYKTFEGSEWTKTTLKTACMFPGLAFCILLVLDVVIWSEGSREARVMVGNVFVSVVLSFGLSVPLVFIGSYIGFKGPGIKDALITNEIPREIPKQIWYMSPFFVIMIGGIIPFGAVFNELFSTFTSIGLPQFYYIFGLLFVVLIVIFVEVTIVLCHFQLCGEDYRWWWRSYLTAGSLAVYVFIYATFYFFTKFNITEFVPVVSYFGFMLIASCVLFVLMGTIGFYACFWFTRIIYSSMKIV